MINSTYVSELIATRLSHDLIGTIGSVSNAVELFSEDDLSEAEKTEVFSILQMSSLVLSRRLKFFRLCFGLSNATVKDMDDLKKIIEEYLLTLGNPNRPISCEIQIETPKIYKLIMPSVMMMADTLVKGGKIEVKQNDLGIHVTAQSEVPLNAAKLENIDLVLAGKEASENPSLYAPLHYLLQYLSDKDVPVKRVDNTLIIGE